MNRERDPGVPRQPEADETPTDRSLTELGRPSDPALAQEIETAEVTPELLEATGMRRLYEVWRDAARSGERSMPGRAAIDILELTAYIGELSLLEVVDGGRDFR